MLGERQFLLSLRFGTALDRGALLALLTGADAWDVAAGAAGGREAAASEAQAPASAAAAGAASAGARDAPPAAAPLGGAAGGGA